MSRTYTHAMSRATHWMKRGDRLKEAAETAEVDRRIELYDLAAIAYRASSDWSDRALGALLDPRD